MWARKNWEGCGVGFVEITPVGRCGQKRETRNLLGDGRGEKATVASCRVRKMVNLLGTDMYSKRAERGGWREVTNKCQPGTKHTSSSGG